MPLNKPCLRRNLVFVVIVMIFAACSTSDALQQYSADKPSTESPLPGMWLMPQICGKLYGKMKNRGFNLSPDSLYAPNAPTLSQAVVRLNINQKPAGTGSFVSGKGLILTSYDLAHRAIASASDSRHNYLSNGFSADTMTKEIPIRNYSLYIPVEQKEVMSQINRRLPDSLNNRQRQQQSREIRQRLIAKRKADNEDLRVQIDDFWGGNRQFMSVYKVVRDVRLVHAPPEGSGNFRRYAFLRAYEGPNGKAKTYNQENVPYSPSQYFSIDAGGVSAGDFVMTLGFPGQTYRHESSYALEFYHDFLNPVLIGAHQAILDGLKFAAAQDSQIALQNAARRASVKRNIKHYREVQRAISQHDIITKKRDIENDFEHWIKRDSLRYTRYRRVLNQLDQSYNIASQTGDLLYATVYTLNENPIFKIARLYHSYRQALEDSTREINSSSKRALLNRHKKLLDDINIEARQVILSRMLYMLATLPDGKVMFHLMKLFGDAHGEALKAKIDRYLETQQRESIIYHPDKAEAFLQLPADSARSRPTDDLVLLYGALLESYQFSKKNFSQHTAYLDPAQKRYVEGLQKYRPGLYRYADANGTLRLSVGQIRGYSRTDSVHQQPITTFKSLLQNEMGSSSLEAPKSLKQQAKRKPLNVSFLSTTEFTGGSSGSPVLNDRGQLVGLAVNRNARGAVSDYMPAPRLSRTISIDIQYILFLLEQLPEEQLLQELHLTGQTVANNTGSK